MGGGCPGGLKAGRLWEDQIYAGLTLVGTQPLQPALLWGTHGLSRFPPGIAPSVGVRAFGCCEGHTVDRMVATVQWACMQVLCTSWLAKPALLQPSSQMHSSWPSPTPPGLPMAPSHYASPRTSLFTALGLFSWDWTLSAHCPLRRSTTGRSQDPGPGQ